MSTLLCRPSTPIFDHDVGERGFLAANAPRVRTSAQRQRAAAARAPAGRWYVSSIIYLCNLCKKLYAVCGPKRVYVYPIVRAWTRQRTRIHAGAGTFHATYGLGPRMRIHDSTSGGHASLRRPPCALPPSGRSLRQVLAARGVSARKINRVRTSRLGSPDV